MRALHLLKTAVGATWAWRQIRELGRLGVEVHVGLPDGPLVPRYEAVGARVHLTEVGFRVGDPRGALRAARAVRSLVDRVAPDVIHSHFVNTTVAMRVGLGRGHATPRCFQVPGPLHLENRLTRAAELALAGPADHWIGSCHWTCERYRRSGVRADHVHESVYGVDVDDFAPRRPAGLLRAELGVGPTTPLVGMVAYMYAPKRYLGQRRGVKGHEDLVDAVARVRRDVQDVLAVFIGGPWDGAVAYERQVRAYAHRRLGDAARFLGTRTDVPDLLQDLDVVALPSHSENIGGAAEALLLERPAVASDVGGLPDLIREGETGWLVPARDPEALARALRDALTRPEEAARRARRGLALTRQVMDVRRSAAEVADIYERMLMARRRG